MLLIAHRGNIHGPNPERENHPSYVDEAIRAGFDVEVDLQVFGRHIYLGHDDYLHEVGANFILFRRNNLWVHCKNHEAAELMYALRNSRIKWFVHDEQPDVLVENSNFKWHHSTNLNFEKNSICVLPEKNKLDKSTLMDKVAGICSDYVSDYKK